MNADELLQEEASVRQEADRILDDLQIVSHLAQFGDVEIGGAYEYKVMVDRDIDLGLIVPTLDTTNNTHIRKSIGELLLTHPSVSKVRMVDFITIPPPAGKLRGIWFGVEVPVDERTWSIDLWIMTDNDKHGSQIVSKELNDKLIRLPSSTRATILRLKKYVQQSYPHTYFSAAIYKAVVENDIVTTDDVMRYLKSNDRFRRPSQ